MSLRQHDLSLSFFSSLTSCEGNIVQLELSLECVMRLCAKIIYLYLSFSSLTSCEANIDHLELRLERVVRLCANMIDAGRHFSQSNGMFIAGDSMLGTSFNLMVE